jgi:hypothetical protein
VKEPTVSVFDITLAELTTKAVELTTEVPIVKAFGIKLAEAVELATLTKELVKELLTVELPINNAEVFNATFEPTKTVPEVTLTEEVELATLIIVELATVVTVLLPENKPAVLAIEVFVVVLPDEIVPVA